MKAIWIAVISFMCATTSFAEKVDARNKAMEKRLVERKEQKQTVRKKPKSRAAIPQDVVDQYQSLEFQGMPYRFLPLEEPALDTKYPLILSLHGGAGSLAGALELSSAFDMRVKRPGSRRITDSLKSLISWSLSVLPVGNQNTQAGY